MNVKVFCLLVGAVLSWASTAASAAQYTAKPGTPHYSSEPLPPPPYMKNHVIGLLPNARSACPEVKGWPVRKLSELVDTGTSLTHQPERRSGNSVLSRFCVYTREDGPLEFPKPPGLVSAERDRMAVVPFAEAGECSALGDLGQALAPDLESQFLEQVGKAKLTRAESRGVRLVFVDTQPTQEWPLVEPDRFCHGYTMAHLAHRLVCSEGEPCPIQIATRLALRHPEYDPAARIAPPSPNDRAGRLGLVSELALSIEQEVAHWQKNWPNHKLVLNLSVGWDGELPDLQEVSVRNASKLEPSALAVHEAIRHATELGALVIAAAGNRRGGRPDTLWPLLPAAWELRHPARPFLKSGRKLVYAVGGLDWQGMPIANTRRGGLPRLAAYADHAIVRTDGSKGGWTGMYTGTSVGAAVVSSVAAAVWHLRPKLDAAEVMQLIERFSEDLPHPADFYNRRQPKPPFVKQVSLCGTLREICGSNQKGCAALELDCSSKKYRQVPDLALLGLPRQSNLALPPNPHPPSPPCGPRTWRVRGHGTAPDFLCPMELLPDLNTPAADWTGPQPGENPCPTCTVLPDPPRVASTLAAPSIPSDATYALAIDLSPAWRIRSAVLAIHCPSQAEPDVSVELPAAASPSTAKVALELPFPTLEGCTASIDWLVGAGSESRSVQSPVRIYP